MVRLASIAFSGLIAGAAAAQTPGFHLVGYPSGGTASGVSALSQDGSVAVGGSNVAPVFPGFRWTQAGRYDFGLEPGMPAWTPATAVDSTGQTIVGWALGGGFTSQRAYRRVGNGPLVDLGLLPGEERSYAGGVSGDGSIVVGTAEHSQFTEAFGQAWRWSESGGGGGMQGLGYLRPNGTFSMAHAVSRDGQTIVGISQSGGPFGGPREAFVWREGSGMQSLPTLPGVSSFFTYAHAVNADGSVVVGMADAPDTRLHATRWTASGVEDLGLLPGMIDSVAYAVSDDGSVVGGNTSSGTASIAFLWTPSTGLVDLSAFLATHGVTTPADYRLQYVYAISGDGLTIGGLARNLTTNVPEGFVATIPSPATLVILAAGVCWPRRQRG